jgi:TatD DNase family protein
MFLVDSHCHFNLLDPETHGNEMPEVIARAKEQGVGYFLNVCVNIAEFDKLLQTSLPYPEISISAGLHPNNTAEETSFDELVKLGDHPKVVAIGETGLDYFRSSGDLAWQHARFRAHIAAAKKLKKPLIIHTRDAIADTLRIMREEGASDVGGVMHCFSEDWDAAEAALEMGFYISFSGVVTFKNAITTKSVAIKVPLNRMLLETDAPYLAPMPHRGKPNEPAYVRHTAEYIAELRNISFADLATKTTTNFFTLFKGAVNPYV